MNVDSERGEEDQRTNLGAFQCEEGGKARNNQQKSNPGSSWKTPGEYGGLGAARREPSRKGSISNVNTLGRWSSMRSYMA